MFKIRPSVDVEPFEVFCEFNGNVGTTVVKHDHEGYGITSMPGQHDGCSEPGCYSDTISYDATMEQIESLIQISANCEQSIVNNCTYNSLTDISWWLDRNGAQIGYWHGSYQEDAKGCYCALEGDGCDPDTHGDTVSTFLNVFIMKITDTLLSYSTRVTDSLHDVNVDHGILSNSAQLPVTQLNYGGSADRFSWVLYQLGFLRCSGKGDGGEYPSEIIENWVNRIETDIDDLQEATKQAEGDIIELQLHTKELPYNAVYFTAHTNTPYPGPVEVIPFKNVLVDKNSGLDHSTGKITIRTGGVYHFVVLARQVCEYSLYFSIIHNGERVCSAYTDIGAGGQIGCDDGMASCASTIVANKNDNVYVALHGEKMAGYADPYTVYDILHSPVF